MQSQFTPCTLPSLIPYCCLRRVCRGKEFPGRCTASDRWRSLATLSVCILYYEKNYREATLFGDIAIGSIGCGLYVPCVVRECIEYDGPHLRTGAAVIASSFDPIDHSKNAATHNNGVAAYSLWRRNSNRIKAFG